MNNATSDNRLRHSIDGLHQVGFLTKVLVFITAIVLLNLGGLAQADGRVTSANEAGVESELASDAALIPRRDPISADPKSQLNEQQVIPMGMVIERQKDGQSELVQTTNNDQRIGRKQSLLEPVRVQTAQRCEGVSMSREEARRRGPVCAP